MEEVEHSRYVAQLKAEFDSCDTTSTGFLDRDELTVLCRKLHLEAHLPLLLDSLLGDGHYARVNFEEFKEVLVVVLSRSLDVSTSEEDSSYLDPVVPEEEKPKFVKGAKRYGRRSRPDSQPDAALTCDSGDSSPSRTEAPDTSPPGLRRAKLRRSTSLESVESLKSDEEAGSHKDNIQPDFPTKEAPQEEDLADIRGEHTCDQEMDLLLRTLDSRTTPTKFQNVPVCSTPVQASSLQGVPHRSQVLLEGCSLRSTSPSLLTATVGQRVLSQLDDGSGCTSPERVVALWTEEGIRKSRDILQMLDFPLEERLSLADLTLALDNELLVSGNGIHQAALISYKNEIQHLLVAVEQASQERDKAKADLDLADQRNLQLVREVDDHHANMETLNQSRIRDLEQDFRDRLTALRSQAEQESEALLQQVERERGTLQEDLRLLRVQEAELQEELCRTTQENCRLEEEVCVLKLKLTDAESSVDKLQSDLDLLLQDKFGSLDPASSGLNAEERLSEIVKEYDLQCRELQDRNDELSSELELLKSQRSSRKSRCPGGVEPAAAAVFSWTEQRSTKASNSDDSEMKRSSPYPARKELQPDQQTAVATLDGVPGAAISIQTELAVEQLKQKHEQELQQLNIQLETQVNYYERSLELMRRSMELERKDISQAFKLEISELEEQKAQAERQAEQLKEALDKLQIQLGGGGWSCEQERRMQRERAETEQNFAREIRNLVQRLSTEKEQLEAELKLKMDQEVMLVRTQLEGARSDNVALKERLSVLQQEVQALEDDVAKKRRELEEMEQEHECCRQEEERLHKENATHREEVLSLSSRNLQLSHDNSELSARLSEELKSVQMLQDRLASVSKEQEEGGATVLQQQAAWMQERCLLEEELSCCKDKLVHLVVLEAELSSLTQKQQWLEEERAQLLRNADEHNNKVETLQHSLLSLEEEAELLRSQLHAISQEKLGHAQCVADLQRTLQDAQSKVQQLEAEVRKLLGEKEELGQAQEDRRRQASGILQEETRQLRVQNQELQLKLSVLQVQSLDIQQLIQEQQNLKAKLNHLESTRPQTEDRVEVDAPPSLAQVQQQNYEGSREQVVELRAQLQKEKGWSQQLEEELRLQAQESCSQISVKQDQYVKAMAEQQQRTEELEIKLKGVRVVLEEKVQQLREQLAKNNKSSMLLKDVYVENAQLMKALQVTEQRQKNAEKKNFLLEEKVNALNKLLREIVLMSLAT